MTAIDTTAEDQDLIRGLLDYHLAALGVTPEQVADTLRREGITGLRETACDCPVANYLKKVLVEVTMPIVIEHREPVVTTAYVSVPALHLLDHRLPHAVALFIERFDQGHYNELSAA